MADIFNIAGEINSTSQEGTAVHANQVKDDLQNKKQSEVNQEVSEELTQQATQISNETTRAEGAEHTLQQQINAITGDNFVSVAAFTDLPPEGEVNTIYRVSSWDGTQVDASKYAEYAWTGSAYQLLTVRSAIGEVFDISAYNLDGGGNPSTYADLSAALGTNGANVPVGVRAGGMQVRFIQSSDNKYVQYRYMGTSIANADFKNPANWQGVDEEPTAGSDNLVKSGGVAKILGQPIQSGELVVTEHADVFYQNLGYTIPEGTKLHLSCTGIGTVVSKVMIIFGASSSDEHFYITENEADFIAPDDFSRIRLRVYRDDDIIISGGTVTATLYYNGILQELNEIKNSIPTIPDFSTGEKIENVAIVNDFSIGGEHNVASAESLKNVAAPLYHREYIGEFTGYDYYINTSEKYVAAVKGLYALEVTKGDVIEVIAQDTRVARVGFLNSLNNMVDDGDADFMEGNELITIDATNSAIFVVTSNGYFFYDSVYGSIDITPKRIYNLSSIGDGVYLSDLKNTKTILEGSGISKDNGTLNIIPATNIDTVPAGTTIRFILSGIGDYYSKWAYAINGGTTVRNMTSNVAELVFDVPVTKIRVMGLSGDYIAEGEVTAKVELDDVGNIIEKAVTDIADMKEEISSVVGLNVNVDSLKSAAGVSTNVFTESFSLNVSSNLLKESNAIISCVASYTTNDYSIVPTIQVSDSRLVSINKIQSYIVGAKDVFDFKQWRHLMLLNDTDTITVSFNIPSGVELTIKSFAITTDNTITRSGFKTVEHSSYWGRDFNTSLAFREAAVGGYYAAVVVPKLTIDGVFVCYHDDDTLATNNNLQMIGGEALTAELGALKMNQLTFAQTQLLEYKSTNVLGEHPRIPTLEEFFISCAKTGVHPCLSCHPTYTVAQWTAIRNLADKHGVLDKLTIKHSASVSEAAEVYQAFGNNIEMYLWNVSTSSISSYITDLQSLSFDKTKVKIGLEFMNTTYAINALSDISDLTELGYVWGVFENTPPDPVNFKTLLDAGCYESTLNSFFSNGLNW